MKSTIGFILFIALSLSLLPPLRGDESTTAIIEEIRSGFIRMTSDLGDCPEYRGLTAKDLVKPNACFENVARWKGPYVKAPLADEINRELSSVGLVVFEKSQQNQNAVYQVRVDVLSTPPVSKVFEAVVPKLTLSDFSPTTRKECAELYYREVVREKTAEDRFRITAKGGNWDSISAVCRQNLGVTDYQIERVKDLSPYTLGLRVKTQSLVNAFWSHMKIGQNDRIISVNGTPITYEGMDLLRADAAWPKKEGLVLEIFGK